jgi:hypothetical protein
MATATLTLSANATPVNVARYRVSPEVCFSTDQDGTVILSVERGKFHSLIRAGSKAWSKIAAHAEGVTVGMVVDELLMREGEFIGEQRENVEQAFVRMLDMLVANGLIETSNRPASRAISTMRRNACLVTAVLVRRVAEVLIRWRRPHAAALLELTMFQVIRQIGRFPARQATVKHWPIRSRRNTESGDIKQLCEAVDVAATWYPKESLCLQKASVTTCLLRQYGIPAEMKIGIRKQPFSAHAWVEIAGNVVGDHRGVQKYFRVIASW